MRIAADASFLPTEDWLACKGDPMFNGTCYIGMDLASVADMAALVCYWPDTGAVQAWGWVGRKTLEQEGHIPVEQWLDDGLIFCDGETIDKRSVASFLSDLCYKYEVGGIAYDRWGIDSFNLAVDAIGVDLPELTPFGQGFKDMAPAVNALEYLVLEKLLVHDGNPLLTWQWQNIQVDLDAAGNRKFTKAKAKDKIDAMIALVQAIGLYETGEVKHYDFSDIVVNL